MTPTTSRSLRTASVPVQRSQIPPQRSLPVLRRWRVSTIVLLASLLGLQRAQADPDPSRPPRLHVAAEAGQLVIRNADSRERLAALQLSGEPRAVASVGQVLYIARRGRGVAIVDLRDPRTPREVGDFENDLVVDRLQVSGDVLQLRSPSGHTIAASRLRTTETPTLLMRLQAWDDDREPPSEDTEQSTAATRHPAPPEWLRLTLRDGSQVTGLVLPPSSAPYLVLRLSNRATLTLLQSEIAQRQPAPVSPSQTTNEPPGELPLALRAVPPAETLRQEVNADGGRAYATTVGERHYVVDGEQFRVYRGRGDRLEALGITHLPWAGQPPPIVYGRGAYVLLPHRGLAVVDIGLSRFPYVVWHLLPHHAITSARLEGHLLHVTMNSGKAVFDLADPLRPQGPERTPPLRAAAIPKTPIESQLAMGAGKSKGGCGQAADDASILRTAAASSGAGPARVGRG